MNNLIIPNLKSNSEMKFYLTGEIYGENPASISFSIKVPKACPLINKTKTTLEIKNTDPTYEQTPNGKVFNITYYRKFSQTRSGFYRLRLKIPSKIDRGDLKVGDQVLVQVPMGSPLIALNNKTFSIIRIGPTTGGTNIDIEVANSNSISSTTSNLTNSTVTNSFEKIERKNFTISIEDKIFNNLINERNPVTGSPLISQVIDTPIYAYKNFEGEDSASVQKKLMNVPAGITVTVIDEKERPPIYSNAQMDEFFTQHNKPSITKLLRTNRERNFLFYVTVARYYYANNKWYSQWLQINQNKQPIWGKAYR